MRASETERAREGGRVRESERAIVTERATEREREIIHLIEDQLICSQLKPLERELAFLSSPESR